MLARAHEQKTSCLPNLSDSELLTEIRALENDIRIIAMLLSLHMHQFIGEMAPSQHVILHLPKNGELEMHPYDLEIEASTELLRLEKENPEDDIVLVGASSAEEVTSAFRNYFKDVRGFIELLEGAGLEIESLHLNGD